MATSKESMRKKKQDFLRINVLDEGYQPTDFLWMLQNVKAGSVNIENWTLEELEIVTESFYKMQEEIAEKSLVRVEDCLELEGKYIIQIRSALAKMEESNTTLSKETKSQIHVKEGIQQAFEDEKIPREELKKVRSPSPRLLSNSKQNIDFNKKEDTRVRQTARIPHSAIMAEGPSLSADIKNKGVSNRNNDERLKRTSMFFSFPSEISTAVLPSSELTITEISITIRDTKIKEGGLFTPAIVYFNFETEPFSWKVSRTYKDCLWLREQLRKQFPYAVIPLLDKKGVKDSSNAHEVMRSRAHLQSFFDEFQRSENLRTADVARIFLSEADSKIFAIKVREVNNLPVPKKVWEIKDFKGEASVNLSPVITEHADACVKYIAASHVLYQKVIKSTEESGKLMAQLSDSLIQNAELFQDLSDQHKNIKCDEIAEVFSFLQSMSMFLGEAYRKRATVFTEKLAEFFQYFFAQTSSMLEISTAFESMQKECLKKEDTLYAQKEKLFKAGNVQQWGLSPDALKKYLPSDLKTIRDLAFPLILQKKTREFEETKITYGFYANKLKEEIERISKNNYRKMVKHFYQTIIEGEEIQSVILNEWIDLKTRLEAKKKLIAKGNYF